MCACRHKKTFLIKDILSDTPDSKKITLKRSNQYFADPTPTLTPTCNKAPQHASAPEDIKIKKKFADFTRTEKRDERDTYKYKWEVQMEPDLKRRVPLPLHPKPMKLDMGWLDPTYVMKDVVNYPLDPLPTYMYFSNFQRPQPVPSSYVPHPLPLRQPLGFEADGPCCGWWGPSRRRKGGQVRFSATQTGMLEQRFNVNKYLSTEDRRALAAALGLSDKQVKTWFQNRRAKWRRTTPDAADGSSPLTIGEVSDDDVEIADVEQK